MMPAAASGKRPPDAPGSELYPALLSPWILAGRRLRNRVVHASMTTGMAQQARVSERLVDYFAGRARGGAAMIVSEPLSMARHQDQANRVRAWNDDDVDGLARLAEAVEREDCRLLAQILDRGRGRNVPGRNPDATGASALPDDLSWSVPRPLAIAEIRSLIDEFARSAARLQRCGFSGVEISAGHGHLIHQFLSPWSNARTDAYGGDLEGRTRLLVELVEALRACCGSGFIVGVKLPGDDGVPGGIGPAEAAAIAGRVTAPGNIDYVCFAQGSHARSLERHVPDGYGPRAPYLGLIRELRNAVPGVPVAALGRITDPAEADAIVARGDAELVALGRTLVADPAWTGKAASGRAHDIRYCVSCNTCWERITALRLPIACDNNPRVGEPDEADWWPKRVAKGKRVVVVGAGIAGMEAAWVAAARGHAVTVFGASREVGGKARLRSLLPGGEAVSSIYDYQFAAARRAGAAFELGVTASVDDILALQPDTVVLACGARMLPPPWLPAELLAAELVPDLRSAITGVLRLRTRQSGVAVVFDMDHTDGTYASVELLHATFERAVVLTPRESIAQDTSLVTRQGILRRFEQKHVRTIVHAEPRPGRGFEEGALDYVNVHSGDVATIDGVAFFAWSTPRVPADELAEPLREAGVDVRAIGDCRSARGVLAATAEGHELGNAI